MAKKRSIAVILGFGAVGLLGLRAADDALPVEHAECTFFGPDHDKFVKAAGRGFRAGRPVKIAAGSASAARDYSASALTEAVTASLAPPPGTRTGSLIDPATTNTIDRYLFQAMAEAKVTPAAPTTDYEFVRRVTLDLTGRIPSASQVTDFSNDSAPDKRAKY